MIDPNRDDPVEKGTDHRPEPTTDNDQDSHVTPADNDGETVPADEVAERVGG